MNRCIQRTDWGGVHDGQKAVPIPTGVWVDSWTHPTVQNSSRPVYFRLFADLAGIDSGSPHRARVAELADARDLGSRGQPWGFKSPLSHQTTIRQKAPPARR
jgi:hypothetical protein